MEAKLHPAVYYALTITHSDRDFSKASSAYLSCHDKLDDDRRTVFWRTHSNIPRYRQGIWEIVATLDEGELFLEKARGIATIAIAKQRDDTRDVYVTSLKESFKCDSGRMVAGKMKCALIPKIGAFRTWVEYRLIPNRY